MPLSEEPILHITRSGQVVTLLNVYFLEPVTTFKCLNEHFILLTLPELDVYFHNPVSHRWINVTD